MTSEAGLAHGKLDIEAEGSGTTRKLKEWVALVEAVNGAVLLENYVQMVSSTGTNPPDLVVVSPSNNMDLKLKPKGNASVVISGNTGPPIIGELYAPNNAGATGMRGSIAWDAQHIYICTSTNTWKRVAIATW